MGKEVSKVPGGTSITILMNAKQLLEAQQGTPEAHAARGAAVRYAQGLTSEVNTLLGTFGAKAPLIKKTFKWLDSLKQDYKGRSSGPIGTTPQFRTWWEKSGIQELLRPSGAENAQKPPFSITQYLKSLGIPDSLYTLTPSSDGSRIYVQNRKGKVLAIKVSTRSVYTLKRQIAAHLAK